MGTTSDRYLPQERQDSFPNLSRDLYGVTSDDTEDYNCVAYAAGDTTLWWWPDPFGEYYWPVNAKRRSEEHTSELQSLAYLVCRLLLEKKKKKKIQTKEKSITQEILK